MNQNPMKPFFRLCWIPLLLVGQLMAQDHFIVYKGTDPRTYVIINEKGEEVAPVPDGWKPQRDVADIGLFSEGFHVVYKKTDQKRIYQLMDTSGRLVEAEIPIEFYTKMSDGLISVKTGIKAGYLDATGKVVVPLKYQQVFDFHDGLARVMADNKFGVIDKTGQFVLPPEFREVANISEGLIFASKDKDVFAFYDRQGNQVVPDTKGYFNPQCYSCGRVFRDGLYRVRENNEDQLYGYLNRKGEVAIAPQFEAAQDFQNGLALVRIDGLFGFVDTTGTFAIEPQFQHAQQFYGNSTWARKTKDSPYGMIDKTGNYLVEPQFKNIPYLRYDYWLASQNVADESAEPSTYVIGHYDLSKVAQRILFNQQGEVVLKIEHCSVVRALNENLFHVEWIKKRGSIGYSIIDTKGRVIWQTDPEGFHGLGVNVIGFYQPQEMNHLDLRRTTFYERDKKNLPVFAEALWTFSNLRTLRLNGHYIVNLPEEIGQLKKLEDLDLSNTSIESLPKAIFELQNLKILYLSYNRELKELPKGFFKSMQHLEELHIVGCGFSADTVYEIRKKMKTTRVVYK